MLSKGYHHFYVRRDSMLQNIPELSLATKTLRTYTHAVHRSLSYQRHQYTRRSASQYQRVSLQARSANTEQKGTEPDSVQDKGNSQMKLA